MDYKNAATLRHSTRSFLPNPIEAPIIEKLKASIENYNTLSGLHIQLVLNNGDAMKGLSNSYGMFTGVNNYIAMVGKANGVHEKENIGYYGEKLVLEATEYGLGTCWVAGTFNRDACVCTLAPKEDIFCIIPIGYAQPKVGFKDKLIKSIIAPKRKPLTELYEASTNLPPWFMEGMSLVQNAPSARNKQPVKFAFVPASSQNELPSVRAWVTSNVGGFEQIDLGIAKLHFEIGASDGNWEWNT